MARSRPRRGTPRAMVGNRRRTYSGSACAIDRYTGAPVAICFADDGARHDVAGRQVAGRIVALDEALAGRVDQLPALAAQRFRQQEARRARHAQHRRMELDELEIRHARAGLERHRHAVAGRDRRIGGLAKHLPGAAGGEQRAPARARRALRRRDR